MTDRIDRARLDEALDRVIAGFSGKIGLYARHLGTGEEISRDADTLYPTASVIKIAVLAEILRQVTEEGLDLDRRIELREGDIVGGSGVLKEFSPGLQPTIRDVATMMITVSDNTATNMLIDLAGGVAAINRLVHDRLDLPGVVLHNRIDFDRIGGDVRRLAEATPRAMASLVAAVLDPRTFGEPAATEALRIMRRQLYLDQVPRYLEVTPYWKELGLGEALWVACKTGFFPGTWADAGMIRLPGDERVVYCSVTHESADTSMSSEPEGAVANGRIGRLLVEYWWPTGGSPAPLRRLPG
jgi:beta-lactamase class A